MKHILSFVGLCAFFILPFAVDHPVVYFVWVVLLGGAIVVGVIDGIGGSDIGPDGPG